MGKIIAIGGGFTSYDPYYLVDHVMNLCGKEYPHYLQIPTPAFDTVDTGSMGRFFNCGCEVKTLELSKPYIHEKMIAEMIRWADMIYVPGGNLKFCMDTWNQTGAAAYLREAYEMGKVLFGISSGSMCWFREGFDDCGPRGDTMFVEGLGLLPYCNAAHYETPFWHQFGDAVKGRSLSGIACENHAALCFVDGKQYVLTSPERPDARCWFFDASNGHRAVDLTEHKEILAGL